MRNQCLKNERCPKPRSVYGKFMRTGFDGYVQWHYDCQTTRNRILSLSLSIYNSMTLSMVTAATCRVEEPKTEPEMK